MDSGTEWSPFNTPNKETIVNSVDDKKITRENKPDLDLKHETETPKERRTSFCHQFGCFPSRKEKKCRTTVNNLGA